MREAICLLFLIILSGCSTVTSRPNINAEYIVSKGNGSGLMLASVSYLRNFSGYSVFYREVGGETPYKMQIGSGSTLLPPSMMKWDINTGIEKGKVFAIELPAGEYEFFNWFVSSGYISFGAKRPFSVTFNIVPGKATYIGNIVFKPVQKLGLTVTGVEVENENKLDRDLPIINSKFPVIDQIEVVSSIEKGITY